MRNNRRLREKLTYHGAYLEGNSLYLHADPEDTPKDMYARMGFQVTDTVYEYLCTNFDALKLG